MVVLSKEEKRKYIEQMKSRLSSARRLPPVAEHEATIRRLVLKLNDKHLQLADAQETITELCTQYEEILAGHMRQNTELDGRNTKLTQELCRYSRLNVAFFWYAFVVSCVAITELAIILFQQGVLK